MGTERQATIAILSLVAGLLAAGALVFAGLGVQGGLWSYRTGLTILRWTAWSGLGVVVLSLGACIHVIRATARRGLLLAVIGGLCGIVAFAIPAGMLNKARSLPRIHDITTDTGNPPRFVDVLPLREKAGASNSAVYGGAKIAGQQKRGYPDIAPVNTAVPPRQAFNTALAVAADLGWQIVSSIPGQGRIEATDTTFWFGFTDDIVIRVAAAGNGSRIDVRSVSRVGRSDVGANAARIRRFLAAMTTKLAR